MDHSSGAHRRYSYEVFESGSTSDMSRSRLNSSPPRERASSTVLAWHAASGNESTQ